VVAQVASFDNDTATTDNRLARFSSTGAFTAANAGSTFTALSAGLYEFRATMVNASTDINAFGVDVRDGSGNPYNVYTIGQAAAPDSAMLVGAVAGATSPVASITQPVVFFPYVNRGCSIQTSNYDMDTATTGAGSSASITDTLGSSTLLTMSGDAAHVEDTVTAESTAAVNLESLNYGLYTVLNDTGTQDNRAIDWRVADFQGWNAFVAGQPADPVSAIRTYLPNGYSPATGSPNAVAPVEPVLGTSTRLAGGANPPVATQSTTFLITASVFNPTANALSNVQITVPIVPGGTYVAGSQQGCIDGVGPVGSGCGTESAAAPACTVASGAAFRRCTFASLAAGSVASLNIQVAITPAATSTFQVTGSPAAGTPPPDTTVWAQYTPAFNSAAFPRSEVLGPACELVAYAPPRVDLSIASADSPDPVSAGANLTYTLTVNNNGPQAAPTATLTDAVPAGTTFQSMTAPSGWTCSTPAVGGTGTVTCAAGPAIAVGAPATFTLVVQVSAAASAGSTITNTASVTSAGNETSTANNSASANTTVATRADLAVAKSDSPDPVLAGGDITYTLVVTNNGPSGATNATLTDVVPANTSFQAVAIPAGWSCTTPAVGGTGTLSCTRATLPAGTISVFTVVVRVSAGTTVGTVITNTAAVTSATTDSVSGNNTASATTTVSA